MSFECPVCHHPIPFMRLFFTTAWGSFQCTGCDSQLGVHVVRRVLVVPIWMGLYFALTRWIRLPAIYDLPSVLITFMALFVLYFAWFDQARVIQRVGFHCKDCGYDLQGQQDPRCPECGRTFDEVEISLMKRLLHIDTAKPRKKSGVAIMITMIILFIFTVLVVIGTRMYKAQTPPPYTPPTTAQTPVAP